MRKAILSLMFILLVTPAFSLTSKLYIVNSKGGELDSLKYVIQLYGNEDVSIDLSNLKSWGAKLSEQVFKLNGYKNVTLTLTVSKNSVDRCVFSKEFCNLQLPIYAYVNGVKKEIASLPIQIEIKYLNFNPKISKIEFNKEIDIRKEEEIKILINNDREGGYATFSLIVPGYYEKNFTYFINKGANEVKSKIKLPFMYPGNYTLIIKVFKDKLFDEKNVTFEVLGFSNITFSKEENFKLIGKEIVLKFKNYGNDKGEVNYLLPLSNFEKLFVSYSSIPISKEGVKVMQVLDPMEELEIVVKFNYIALIIAPIVIIALLLLISMLRKKVIVKKSVIKVSEDEGEKVVTIAISIKNYGKPIENVRIIEKLPAIASKVGKFETLKGVVNKKEKTITWEIERIERGEEIIINYTIKTKLQIIGRVPLSETVVKYRVNGEEKEEKSNKVFINF